MTEIQRAKAFYEAKKKYIPFLSSILWQLSGPELFTEAMHCALFGIWRNVEKLNGEKAPKTLYHIALTANATAWKHRKQRQPSVAVDTAADTSDRHRQLRQSFAAIVREALAELPLRQSQAIVMHYVERKGHHDIAQALGCHWKVVQNNLKKALEAIKRRVAKQHYQVA